jgi:FkbM family methyltransferase
MKPSIPVRVGQAPLPGTAYVQTTYTWESESLTFVTDPQDSDPYVERLRTGFQVEPHVYFACEWLAGRGSMIDVGANIGAVSIPVAALGSRVLAVEALPKNAVLLGLAATQSRLGRLVPVHAAVGERVGTARMSGTSAWAQVDERGGLEVPLLTVDALCDVFGFRKPDVVKIDVEGSERRVLHGMARTLREDRPLVVIESNTWTARGNYTYHELLAELEAHRYSLYLVAGFVLAPRTSADLQEACVSDFVAAPRPLKGRHGPFEVRALTTDERFDLLARDVDVAPAHRWHIASVLHEYRSELAADPRVDRIRQAILRYDETLVRAALETSWV